jgi:IclR family acetate operon transcriptional repressor
VSATVEKALQLLEALSRAGGAVGISQLGRELKLNKSTVYRLVDTLCRHGYARQEPASGRYLLTVKLWELGSGVIEGLGLRQTARPLLESVARETDETTMLGIVHEHEALIIDRVDSSQALRIFSAVGARVPLHSCAIGRALLAYQSADVIDDIGSEVKPLTSHSVATLGELKQELSRIRAKDCSTSYDEWQVGVAAVASPIRDAGGRVVAAFCITGPTSRLVPDGIDALGERCVAAARSVSKLLGYNGN